MGRVPSGMGADGRGCALGWAHPVVYLMISARSPLYALARATCAENHGRGRKWPPYAIPAWDMASLTAEMMALLVTVAPVTTSTSTPCASTMAAGSESIALVPMPSVS